MSTELVNPGPNVRVMGQTNLPDETQLTISVQEAGDFGLIFPQASVIVRRGRFETPNLGPDDGWADGELEASALMPVASTQPQSVQVIIGPDGQNLRGKLVQHEDIGTTVERTIKFVVGTDPITASAAGLKRHREMKDFVEDVLRVYSGVVQRGRRANRADDVGCMSSARGDWALLEQYKTRLEHLPLTMPGVGNLRTLESYAHDCTACVDDFAGYCDDADNEIKEARASLAQSKLK